MKTSRITIEQIAFALRQVELDATAIVLDAAESVSVRSSRGNFERFFRALRSRSPESLKCSLTFPSNQII